MFPQELHSYRAIAGPPGPSCLWPCSVFSCAEAPAGAPASLLQLAISHYDPDGEIIVSGGGTFTAYVATMAIADVLDNASQTRAARGIMDLSAMDSCYLEVGTLTVGKEALGRQMLT